MDILKLIDELRETDLYIRYIYTEGGCYRFHILLSKLFPGCKPYINEKKNHIITRYKNKYYDIDGVVTNQDGYVKLTKEDEDMVKRWSFHKNNLLMLTECPNCDEPIIYETNEKRNNRG
jgi:hypothetical protein